VVVSKEEVAVGRKGSGGEWGSTSRNAGLAGPAPQMVGGRILAKNTPKCRSKPELAGDTGLAAVNAPHPRAQFIAKVRAMSNGSAPKRPQGK
jgi:hypothetical protein